MFFWLLGLGLAVVVLVIAGISWTAVRREKARLGFLHGAARGLLEARDLRTPASVDVLRGACRRFGADCGELTLIPETGTAAAFRTTVRGGEPVDVMRSTDLEDAEDGALTRRSTAWCTSPKRQPIRGSHGSADVSGYREASP